MTLHAVTADRVNDLHVTASPDSAAQQAELDRVRYFVWCEDDHDDAGDVAVYYATADEQGD